MNALYWFSMLYTVCAAVSAVRWFYMEGGGDSRRQIVGTAVPFFLFCVFSLMAFACLLAYANLDCWT